MVSFFFKTLAYRIHFQKQKHILNAKGYDTFNGNKVTLLWFILDECLLKYSNYNRWCMASVYQELLLSSSVLTSSKLQFRFCQGIFISILSNPGRYNVISEKINGNLEKECKKKWKRLNRLYAFDPVYYFIVSKFIVAWFLVVWSYIPDVS